MVTNYDDLIEDDGFISVYPDPKEKTMTQKYNERHGGPYDRGSADSYYRRGYQPHYFLGGTHVSPKVTEDRMTTEELDAYRTGYDENEARQDYKDYR